MKNKKALIGVIAAVVAAAAVITVMVAKNASAPDKEQATPEPTVEATQIPADTTPEPSQDEQNASASASPDRTDSNQPSDEPEKVYTPTFMYFVSNSDEGYDATMVVVDELKKEYGSRVKFDIRNIDDDPELVKNFPVKDNTPTLIMLNTKNDISNILFKTKDKDKLKEAIVAAIQG